MDPQKLSQLDPKLRDAYQRVMGTPIPQVQTQPASPRGEPVQAQTPPPPPGQPSSMPDPIPTPAPMPQPEPTPTPTPTIQEPPVTPFEPPAAPPTPTPEPSIPQQPPTQPSNFVQMNSEVASAPSQNFTTPSAVPQSQTIALKKKNGMMMPILFGVVGLVFIVVYTLFWTKIFNFKLPFLP